MATGIAHGAWLEGEEILMTKICRQCKEDAYFVIVTRGRGYDEICLEKMAQENHIYISMIGSGSG